ncbi:MAG: hypothetical protein U9N42_07045 [Campylobacterota bacterium]|nr:hypothetical protein [Campylobacterota bacterium]
MKILSLILFSAILSFSILGSVKHSVLVDTQASSAIEYIVEENKIEPHLDDKFLIPYLNYIQSLNRASIANLLNNIYTFKYYEILIEPPIFSQKHST